MRSRKQQAPADVFVSYSRHDSERVLALAKRLRERGVDVWLDQSGIEAAASWSEQIVAAIRQCKVFVLLASDTAFASDNVAKELSIASECKQPILPIYLEPAEIPDSMRYQLAGIQYANLYGDNEAQSFEDVLAVLSAHGVKLSDGTAATPEVERKAVPAARRRRALVWTGGVIVIGLAAMTARQLMASAVVPALLVRIPADLVTSNKSARIEIRSVKSNETTPRCSHATNGGAAVLFAAETFDRSALEHLLATEPKLDPNAVTYAPPCTLAIAEKLEAAMIAVDSVDGTDVAGPDGHPLKLAVLNFEVESRRLQSLQLEKVPR